MVVVYTGVLNSGLHLVMQQQYFDFDNVCNYISP